MIAFRAVPQVTAERLSGPDWPAALPLLEGGGALRFEPSLSGRPLNVYLCKQSPGQVVVVPSSSSSRGSINFLP